MTSFQKVEYYKPITPPSLNQYLVNRAMKEKSSEAKSVKGVVRDKVTGRLMPRAAVTIRDSMKGMKADKVAKERPEWVKEYPSFVKEWTERQREILRLYAESH
jgi:hypothetical protein